MKPTGKVVVEQMYQLIGTPYEELDCQAAIEEAVKRAGGNMDYRGSNDMARNLAWLGTLSNAKRILGDPLPVGAALFIHFQLHRHPCGRVGKNPQAERFRHRKNPPVRTAPQGWIHHEGAVGRV